MIATLLCIFNGLKTANCVQKLYFFCFIMVAFRAHLNVGNCIADKHCNNDTSYLSILTFKNPFKQMKKSLNVAIWNAQESSAHSIHEKS